MKRLLFLLFLLLPLLLNAAGPPPGTFIVPSFFTTNGAKIYGTNGIAISSNAVTGIYIVDGSGIVSQLVWTNNGTSIYPLFQPTSTVRITNSVLTFIGPGGSVNQATIRLGTDQGLMITNGIGEIKLEVNDEGTLVLARDGQAPVIPSIPVAANGAILLLDTLNTMTGLNIADDGFLFSKVGSLSFSLLPLTNTFTDILGTGQIALTNGVANQIAKFKSIQPGSGMLATNQGTNVVLAWDHTMTNGLGVTGPFGFSLQSNAFGGTVGGSTNFVIGTTTNINLTATNTATGNGTNTAWLDLPQSVNTNASPQFLNEMIHVDLMLAKGASNRLSTQKSRAWMLTNFLGGYGAWQTVTPMPVRRQWFYAYDRQNGVGAIGLGDVSSIGSLNNVNCTTNAWPQWSYATGSSITSNGIQGNSLNVLFPGKNIFFATEGRVSLITTQRTWIGLTSGTSVSMGNTDTPTTLSVAALRLSSSAAGLLTNWSLVTCDGSGCTATDGPISLTTTNRHVFEVMEDRANVRWLAYIDGTAVATNTGNLPIAAMQPIMMITSLGAESAKTIFGSCLYHEQDNRQDTGNITPNP